MILSRFLPDSFDAEKPVALIAGKAMYPKLTLDAMRAAGIRVRLIGFEGETREDIIASFSENERVILKVGQLGRMLKAIAAFQAAAAIMVGQVTPGRLFKRLHPDGKAVLMMARLKERNAETIFGAIAGEVEKLGVTMLDARSFLDHHLAVEGAMTGGQLRADPGTVEHGVTIAREAARLNIGQSVVVSRGTVIAVEAFEGTDEMLRRAGRLAATRPIFVKAVKPKQDYRFDVPVFGARTVEVMEEADVRLACLQAGSTIILDKVGVVNQARIAGIQIYGYR
jgi:DUF1009 family protein